MPFARAGSFGKRRFTPPKQRDYVLEARRIANEAMAGRRPLTGPLKLEVEAWYEIPKSWSRKKREEAFWKESRPDADNLAKAVMDAIGGNESLSATDKLGAIVFGDDASVCVLGVEKRYGSRAFVRVSIRNL